MQPFWSEVSGPGRGVVLGEIAEAKRIERLGMDRMMLPGWVLGSTVACAVFFIAVRFGSLAFGMPGLLFTPFVAFWVGAGAASLVDTRRPKRDAVIIALFVVALLIAYVWQVQTRLGMQGGPNL